MFGTALGPAHRRPMGPLNHVEVCSDTWNTLQKLLLRRGPLRKAKSAQPYVASALEAESLRKGDENPECGLPCPCPAPPAAQRPRSLQETVPLLPGTCLRQTTTCF